MTNDTEPLFPFEQRQAAIELRRRALADAMRQANLPQQELPGRMVSGHYVAPSWAQSLNALVEPITNRAYADQQQAALLQQVQDYANADQQAARAHMAARPQGQQLPPGQVGPTAPPTTQEVLQWAQAGQAIPSRRNVVEKVMNDLEVNEPVRQEARQARNAEAEANRQFRKEEGEANRAARAEELRARLEQQAEAARLRSEDTRLAIEQRREAAGQHRDLMLQLGELKASGAKEKPGKTLPAGTVKDLGELDERVNTLSSLSQGFKDSYSGPVAAAKSTVSPYVPGMDSSAADWWRDYKKQQELVERHSLFGATLTAGEQQAWRKADINANMRPEVIRKNLEARAALAEKVARNALQRYGAAGYNVEGLGRAPLNEGGASGNWDSAAPAQATTKVRRFNPATGRLE